MKTKTQILRQAQNDKQGPKDRAERIARGLWWDKALTLVEGCTNVSEACENCWAAKQTHTRAKQSNPKIKARYSGLTKMNGQFNGTIRMQWEALKIPMSIKTPTRFAVWNDLFHEDVTDQFISCALFMMERNPRHTFIVLTKRPDRMRRILSARNGTPKPNIWPGVTVEMQKYEHRIVDLLATPASVRVVSYEPALGPVDFKLKWFAPQNEGQWLNVVECGHGLINWMIMGCESGGKRRPMDIEWARQVQKQCADAGVAFFLKQMEVEGKVVGLPELDGKTYCEIPEGKI